MRPRRARPKSRQAGTMSLRVPLPLGRPADEKGSFMLKLDESQIRQALLWLVSFHVAVITASNYLVQLPFTLWGLHTTWGACFPFHLPGYGLTVRLFGKSAARRIIAGVMVPALMVSYAVSAVPAGPLPGLRGAGTVEPVRRRIALAQLHGRCARPSCSTSMSSIACAACAPGWVAPTLSTIRHLADTFAFFAIAFWHGPDPSCVNTGSISPGSTTRCEADHQLLFFLPLYGVLLAWLGRVVLSGHDETLPGLPRR